MAKCRIVFFSGNNHLPWGGSEELWEGVASHFLEKDFEIDIITRRWPFPVEKINKLALKGAQLHYYDLVTPSLFKKLSTRIFKKQEIYKALFHSQFVNNPKLWVVSLGNPYSQAFSFLRECVTNHVNYVIIVQLASEFFWPADDILDQWLLIYKNAAKVFFVSKDNQELIQRQLGFVLENAEVVWNPFQVNYFQDPTWPDSVENYNLACVGRLMPLHKGQDLLLEVLKEDKWKNRNLHVNLYGGGENLNSLQRLKNMYQIKNVNFHAFTNDVKEIWRTNHGGIFPSRMEGMPLALLEAMLSYRMSIITDLAGGPEIVIDEFNGFIAEAPTIRHLDNALEKAWARRADWQQMGLKAGISIRKVLPTRPAESLTNKLIELI